MSFRTILFLIPTILLANCNPSKNKKISEKQLNENIMGDWEIVLEKKITSIDLPPPGFSVYQGMTISNDYIDFYLIQTNEKIDSITGKRTKQNLGTYFLYKTQNDSIFLKNPLTENWEYKWKYLSRKNDVLELMTIDSAVFKFKKLHFNLDTLPNFDQIILSSSECYGNCPILDISIDKNGSVLFQGEQYVKLLGFYYGKLDSITTENIFNKFRRANPLRLQNHFAVEHTDDQTVSTTFVQNGKIVKTIYDYGMAGTKELIWAYLPLLKIHSTNQLDSLKTEIPFYHEFNYFTFKKDSLALPLKKSESFLLWTELKKAKQTLEPFNSKYNLTFNNKENMLNSVTSDGRYYRFEYKNKKQITFDLGYNFIDRNFKNTNFSKLEF